MKNVERIIPVITFFAGIMVMVSLGLKSQDSSLYRKADTLKPETSPTIATKPEKQRVIDAQADSLAAISDRLLKKPVLPEKVSKKLVSDINAVNSEVKKVNRSLDRMISLLVPRTSSIIVEPAMPVIHFSPIEVNSTPVDSIRVTVPEPPKRAFLKRIFH